MPLQHHFQPEDRGAAFRPPAIRLYRRPVSTVKPPEDPGDQEYTVPSWGNPIVEPFWHPLSLRWGSNGQISTLRIKVVLGQGEGKSRERPEDSRCNPGDEIELMQMSPGAGPQDKVEKNWFTGHVGQEAMLIQAHPDVESVTLTAYGPELLLSHKVITGMWCANTDEAKEGMKGELSALAAIRENVWEARLPAIMNPKGKGNAWAGDTGYGGTDPQDWQLTSKADESTGGYDTSGYNVCKVFASPGTTAGKLVSTHWTAWTALVSVVEWIDDYDVISLARTNWKAIQATLGDTPIGEVNLTGKNLLQAMRAILVPIGFGFALEPWADKRCEHRLIVFRLRNPRNFANVNMAPILDGNVDITSAEGRRAMVQRVDYLRDNHTVKNHIIIMGTTKITERSLDFDYNGSGVLQPAWDTSIYNLDDYDSSNLIGGGNWASEAMREEWAKRYRLKGTDYLTYARVFRAFAWNEDGGLSDVIKVGGDPLLPTLTNFSRGADAQRAMFRPRPPLYRIKYTDAPQGGTTGAFEPPLILLGIAGDDDSWVKAPTGSYTLDKSRCVIHFKVPDLANWYPWKSEEIESSGNTLHKLYSHLNFATALHNSLRAYGAEELRIRLMAGFEMDDSASYTLARELDSSWPFDARVVIPMLRRFKYRDIGGDVSANEPATVDDESGDDIFNYAVRARDTLEDATGHGSVVLRGLHRAYYPGQGLRKLSGRNIDLSLPGRRQNKAASIAPVIVGITWHFAGGVNKTELLLETGQIGLPG